MDDILPIAADKQNALPQRQPTGCSTICVNENDCVSVVIAFCLEISSNLMNMKI